MSNCIKMTKTFCKSIDTYCILIIITILNVITNIGFKKIFMKGAYIMEETKKKLKFKKRNILVILSVILMLLLFILLLQLDVLPTLYLVLIIGAILFVNILGFIFFTLKKKVFLVLGVLLFFISILISSIGSYYIYHTNRFLNTMFNYNTITDSNIYYLIKGKKNEITKESVKDDVLYFSNDDKMKKAIKKLKSKYDISMKQEKDIKEMFLKVRDENQLMFIESSSYNIIFELDKDFDKEQFVILDKIDIKSTIKVQNEKKKNSFNIYLGGTDFTYNTRDFNMIVSINTDTQEILLTSIPRDYYIPVYGREDGRCDTLSYMGPYGVDVSVGSLADYFDINIDYYLTFNANNVVDVIDALGGINYCSDESFSIPGVNKVYIHEGCQTINSKQALSIATIRKTFDGGDRARQRHIRKIMLGMLEKLKDMNTITNYANILSSLEGLYETTIPRDVINNLAQTTIKNMGNWKITEQAVDGVDGQDYVHLTQYKDWVMYPDKSTVEKAVKEINRVINQ